MVGFIMTFFFCVRLLVLAVLELRRLACLCFSSAGVEVVCPHTHFTFEIHTEHTRPFIFSGPLFLWPFFQTVPLLLPRLFFLSFLNSADSVFFL